MKLNFEYEGVKVSYQLRYKKISTITINVDKKGEVWVTAPLGTSVATIMDKVKGNARWILAQLQKDNRLKSTPVLREQYMYLGKSYSLELVENNSLDEPKVKLVRGKFVVETPNRQVKTIHDALLSWYEQKLKSKLKERIKYYQNEFEEIPSKLSIEKKVPYLLQMGVDYMNVNIKISVFPISVIDTFIIEAFCKLNKEDYDEKLKMLLPNYEDAKNYLQNNKVDWPF